MGGIHILGGIKDGNKGWDMNEVEDVAHQKCAKQH
jgi:hypothetical protein